ncbi:hypothetical protein Kpol_209p3, partial [Vanderwaltozyma polyspora DSM 70294]
LCKALSDFSEISYLTGKKGSVETSPKELINLSYKKIKNQKIVEVGGTTAIVAHFPSNGNLTVANLGDSWCGVFRDDKLVFETKFQTVGFNAPYQLAIIPDKMLREAKRKGSSYIQNEPSDADEYNFQLKKSDIIVLATDGVTDNVATDDIALFFKEHPTNTQEQLQEASNLLVKNVVKLSKDPQFPSVFAQELSRLSGKFYSGGKEDDITMVVVKVE